MLLLKSRADIAHHVLALTLRRERVVIGTPLRGLTTATATAEVRLEGEYVPPCDVGDAGPSLRPPIHVARRRSKRSGHKQPLAPAEELSPWFLHHLLACVYATQPQRKDPPSHLRKDLSPHRPKEAVPWPVTALSPGIVATDVIALAPPNTPLWKQWELALTRPRDDAARAVPRLLEMSRAQRRKSPAALYPHLSLVHRFINKLSPTKQWNTITRSEHAALLHLWKEFFAVATRLHDMGMLNRQHGPEGFWTQPARITPFLRLVATSPVNGIRDKRLIVQPPKDLPTLEQAFEFLAQLGHKPTVEHLSVLLKTVPVLEILAKAVESRGKPAASPFTSVMLKLATLLTDPESAESSYSHGILQHHYKASPRYDGQRLYDAQFTMAQIALEQLEISQRYDREVSEHWGRIVGVHRPLWIKLATKLAEQQSDTSTWATPTEAQATAVKLLLQYVLFYSPPNGLQLEPDVHGDFDIAEPLDLLRLLLCDGGDRSLACAMPTKGPASKTLPVHVSSSVVRILRAASKRSLFPPVVEVCGLLVESQIPTAARTALYAAGAARYPEDLTTLLPLLLHLNVLEPTGDESPDVAATRLALAREADRANAGAGADFGVESVEAAVAELFRRWKVHPEQRSRQQRTRSK